MIHMTFRRAFLAVGLLTALSASAQESDSELQLSTDVVCWYRICSAAPGMENYAMTDPNHPTEEAGDYDDALRGRQGHPDEPRHRLPD